MQEYQYGTHLDDLPHTTILLCQFSIETAENRDSKAVTHWIRFNNYKTGTEEEKHAETEMCSYLENILPRLPFFLAAKLSIILSNSPCYYCSLAIINFKDKYPRCSIEIKFSNFYKCYNPKEKNVEGLLRLVREGIQLSVFCGINDWLWFIRDKLNLEPDLVAAHYSEEREKREFVDLCILHCIKEKQAQMETAHLCTLIGDMSVKDVISYFKL
jgi:hypothetical protein